MLSSERQSMVLVCLAVISLVLLGCSNENTEIAQELSIETTGFVEAIDQDQFMENVFTLQQSESVLYVSGKGYYHIFALDSSFRSIQTIGRRGEGPGEFPSWPYTFQVVRDRIYNNGTNSQGIQIFSLEGDFLKSISLDPKSHILNQGLLVDQQGYMYLSRMSPQDDYVITKLDSTGKFINSFGALLSTSYTEIKNRQMSARRIVLVNDEYLLAVGSRVPVVEKYSLEGELINSSDLSDTPYFRDRLDFAKDHYTRGKQGIVLVVNYIGIFDNRLYIIPIEGSPSNDNLRVNRLLELDTESLNIINAYTLLDHLGNPLKWVEAFEFISDDELIVFHYTDGIFYRYKNTDLTQH